MIGIHIEDKLKSIVPELTLGCISASVKVEKHNDQLWAEIESSIKELRASLNVEALGTLPEIQAVRDAYKSIGKDPGRYRGSAEALLRRTLSGKALYRINTVVDINNLVSLRTVHPVGSYDLQNLDSDILFRIGLAGETYKGIGKDIINIADLPVFVDASGPFGSPTSDSERAMIRPETKKILMVIISFVGRSHLERDIDYAGRLLHDYAASEDAETVVVG